MQPNGDRGDEVSTKPGEDPVLARCARSAAPERRRWASHTEMRLALGLLLSLACSSVSASVSYYENSGCPTSNYSHIVKRHAELDPAIPRLPDSLTTSPNGY